VSIARAGPFALLKRVLENRRMPGHLIFVIPAQAGMTSEEDGIPPQNRPFVAEPISYPAPMCHRRRPMPGLPSPTRRLIAKTDRSAAIDRTRLSA